MVPGGTPMISLCRLLSLENNLHLLGRGDPVPSTHSGEACRELDVASRPQASLEAV